MATGDTWFVQIFLDDEPDLDRAKFYREKAGEHENLFQFMGVCLYAHDYDEITAGVDHGVRVRWGDEQVDLGPGRIAGTTQSDPRESRFG